MLPVANKPMLEWALRSLEGVADEIIVVVNPNQKDVISHFSGRCKFAFQEKQLGTAHALAVAEKHVNGRFILINTDEFIPKQDIENFAKGNGCKMAVFTHSSPERFGVVEASNGAVVDITEKPHAPKSNLVRCGMELLDRSVFPLIKQAKPSPRGELELPDVYRLLMKEEEIKAFDASRWVTVSYPWGLLDANKFILDEFGSQIAKDVEIRPGAVLEEPIAIASGAIIGPNCFIRKYSSIGKSSKVGQAVEIKNSIIMENTFVSHLSYVGDSIIGRNCNVGAGTTFANLRLDEKTINASINGGRVDTGQKKLGGIVGDNVKFGVNVTVMPGKKIWPNIMVPPCSVVKEDMAKQPDLKEWSKE